MYIFFKDIIQGLQQCFPHNLHLLPNFHEPVPPFKYVIETPLQKQRLDFRGENIICYLPLKNLRWDKESAIDLSHDIDSARGQKGFDGQRFTSSWQPATKTNRDPDCENTLAWSNLPRISEIYRGQDNVFGYELRILLLSGVLPVFQNLSYELQRRLSGVPIIHWSNQKYLRTLFS